MLKFASPVPPRARRRRTASIHTLGACASCAHGSPQSTAPSPGCHSRRQGVRVSCCEAESCSLSLCSPHLELCTYPTTLGVTLKATAEARAHEVPTRGRGRTPRKASSAVVLASGSPPAPAIVLQQNQLEQSTLLEIQWYPVVFGGGHTR